MAEKCDLEEIKAIREITVEQMESLGVYRAEYDELINIYSQLVAQYRAITRRFERGGYKCQTKSQTGGFKKSPIVATLESLRKDILSYSDRLCLNPKSFDALGKIEKPQKSALETALSSIAKEI